MTGRFLAKLAAGVALAIPATVALAQTWTPGSEIAGQTLQVQTNGIVNNIYFAADGTASITTPSGAMVPATWSAANNQLCLSANGGQECWPYARPFQAGQQMALTSSCNQLTTFMTPAVSPASQHSAGERG